MSNLIAELKKHKEQASALDELQSTLADVQRAYHNFDDARAKLEEVQSNIRSLEHPDFEDEMDKLFEFIEDWLEAMHPISEEMLDWSGRPGD